MSNLNSHLIENFWDVLKIQLLNTLNFNFRKLVMFPCQFFRKKNCSIQVFEEKDRKRGGVDRTEIVIVDNLRKRASSKFWCGGSMVMSILFSGYKKI